MKVVLFCGGLGMRMRADNQSLPKPMTPITRWARAWSIGSGKSIVSGSRVSDFGD